METQMNEYKPINCGFYDYIESAIIKKEKVDLEYYNENNEVIKTKELLTDVYSKDKGEYLKTYSGLIIRLDRLIKIDDYDNLDSCKI